MAINDRGDVAGWSQASDGTCRAFIWQHRIMRELECPNGVVSAARTINNEGLVAGSATYPGHNNPTAVNWVNSQFSDLNDGALHAHGWTLTSPKAMNHCGDIIGEAIVGGLTQSFFLRRTDKKPDDYESTENVVPESTRSFEYRRHESN